MLRNPNTIPKGDTIIEDPAMEPFFITKSAAGAGGYTVYERVTKGEKNTEYIRTVCYPSTFNSALRKVASELMSVGEQTHFKTVKEYMLKWEAISDRMQNLVSID